MCLNYSNEEFAGPNLHMTSTALDHPESEAHDCEIHGCGSGDSDVLVVAGNEEVGGGHEDGSEPVQTQNGDHSSCASTGS